MSSNNPPKYEDLYSQGGSDPAPPPYDIPSNGGPQPNAHYPIGPNTHMYPLPGGYALRPSPGQPHISDPPPMPPMMPPNIPADESSNASGNGWETVHLRHAFIRKVYMILAVQLLFITGILAVFIFVEPVRIFSACPAVFWPSFAVYFITHMVLVYCRGPRRKRPWNMILLFIFTLALSYMTGTISSHYKTKAVFLAMGITAIVCIAVMVFCFQTKVDFTMCSGMLCVLGIVMFVTVIVTTIVSLLKYMHWLHIFLAAVGAIVFTMFLAFRTNCLFGDSIGPDEYMFAALSIYVDVTEFINSLQFYW